MTTSNTFYGVLNGKITTSKNCKREAVHAAVAADGYAFGVANADGLLLVVNRSKELAENWRADMVLHYTRQNAYRVARGEKEIENTELRVVRVFAGKAVAVAAAEKARDSATIATVAPSTVELTDEQKAKAKEFAFEKSLVQLDRRLAAEIQLGCEADIAFVRYAIRVAECSEVHTIELG